MNTLRYNLYGRQLPPVGLALFRIVYSLVLLCEVGQLFYLRRLVFFDSQVSLDAGLVLWLAVVVCLLLGWQTKSAAWVNLAYSAMTFSTFHEWEYHVDYVFTGCNLLLPFLPVSECLSLDAWRSKTAPRRVSVFNYHAPVIVGIALLYFDSMGYKLESPMWMSGLGLWRPASYPHCNWLFDPSWLLDQKHFVIGMGYVVLLFEGSFPFLFFVPVLRLPLFVLGLSFHLAIAIIFPIPWFGLASVAIYLLVLPYGWYDRLDAMLCRPGETATPPRRTLVILTVLAVLLQMPFVARTPFAHRVAELLHVDRVRDAIAKRSRPLDSFSRAVFGCTPHPVFVDSHFDGYDHIVTFEREDGTPGPVIRETGRASFENTGRRWVNWNWRVCGAAMEPGQLRRGIARYTAFYAGGQDARFRVFARAYDTAEGWEAGFYRRQLSKPWVEIGEVRWEGGEFSGELGDVEAAYRVNGE